MSSAVAFPSNLTVFASPWNTGSSKYADALRNIHKKLSTEYIETASRRLTRDALYTELWDAVGESSSKNWDGYGADPVKDSAVDEAYSFLNLLPKDTPVPDIVAEPSGGLVLEWNFGKDRVFVVSINGNYSLAYAGLLGAGSRVKGLDGYSETLPNAIIDGLKRIAR